MNARGWIAALLIAAAAGIAASGSQADDTTGVTKDTVKLGIIGPYSGSASDFSKAQIGVDAYLKSINDAGGINGRKIEIAIEDDGCDEAKAIAATRKLIFETRVFALASAFACSGAAMAAKPVIVESGVPWMVGTAANPDISRPPNKNVFQPTITTFDVGKAIVRFALTKPGAQKIAIISHSNEWAKGYYDGALEELKARDIKAVADLTMERQSTNATPQILKLREVSPDIIIALLYPAESAIFLREAKKFGVTVPILTGYGTTIDDQLKRTGDPEAVKNYFAAYLLSHPVSSPAMAKWRDMIKKYYPREEITGQSLYSLGGAVAIVKAMEAVGPDLTRQQLIAALNNIRALDTGVMAGTLTFTPDDHAGQKEATMAGFVDGKPVAFSAWGKQTD